MLLRLKEQPVIENLRHYPHEIVERLRKLLSSGAEADPDPRRRDFYEVGDGTRVFYIHISPVSGNVFLLAIWEKDGQGATPAPLTSTSQAA